MSDGSVNENVDLDQMVREYLKKVGPIRRAPWHERVAVRIGCWLISFGEKLGGDSERYFG